VEDKGWKKLLGWLLAEVEREETREYDKTGQCKPSEESIIRGSRIEGIGVKLTFIHLFGPPSISVRIR